MRLSLMIKWALAATLTLLVALLGSPLIPPAQAQSKSPHVQTDLVCSACHTISGWQEIKFDHNKTGFELDGRHAEQRCLDCHQVERFTQVSPACASCHVDLHQDALGADCSGCHDTQVWRPSNFVHDMTAFPLWGAHEAIACVQCHANETSYQFLAVAQSCFDCHAGDFGQVRAAVHLQASIDCETCHTQDQWRGGHNPAAFEIRFGPHEVSCGRCHKNSADYLSYTCADCHTFSLDEEEHRGLDPNDARCLDCHSEGEIED
jgi:hypothetical protein